MIGLNFSRRLVLGLGAAVALAAHPAGSATSWSEQGPLIAGTHSYVNGTLVWTDYALDDRGANTDLALAPGGDETAPAGLENMADLVQLQFRVVPEGLHVRAILNGLMDASVPILGVAFDTDANPATGAAAIPGGAWSPQGSLGIDRLAVISSDGADLEQFTGAWSSVGAFATEVDPDFNVLEGTIPAAQLPPLSGSWRVFAVLGVRSGGSDWTQGSAPILDLAFVGDEPPWEDTWQSTIQADVLAGLASSDAAALEMDFTRMTAGDTELAEAATAGFHSFLYRSELDLPEGDGGGDYFGGPYQPYLVWFPDRPLPDPSPLVVNLHGSGGSHLSLAATFALYPPNAGATPSPFYNPLSGAFDYDAIVVFPLGRGTGNQYYGAVEQDILDVRADAMLRLPIDPDRIVLTGASLGAVGTWRIGMLRPDEWSSLVPIISPSNFNDELVLGLNFNPAQLETLHNLPVDAVVGRLDPLESCCTQGSDVDILNLQDLEVEFRYHTLESRHHEVVPGPSNCLFTRALQRTRVIDPARVVFSVEPDVYDADPLHEIRYDSAYWVSEVRMRGEETAAAGEKGTIDVASLARADREPASVDVLEPGGNTASGADFCGPNPAVMTNDTWDIVGLDRIPGPPQPVSNGMSALLTGIESATLDLTRMSLSTQELLVIETSGDGAATLRLAGNWLGSVEVERDEIPFDTLTPVDGAVELADDFSGNHEYVLTPLPEPASFVALLWGASLLYALRRRR